MPSGLKERLGLREVTAGIWKPLLAEFLGNLLLNLFGCGSCLNLNRDQLEPNFVLVSLAFGLAIMMIVQTLGHVSGAHVNPAVTCGMLVTGHITVLKGLLYIVVQCMGAITGTAVLKALTPDKYQATLGTTTVHSDLTPLQGFGIEFFLGLVLVLAVFGVCDANRGDTKGFAPLAIGLTVSLGHLVALDYTGSSMNPARSLGSAVLSGVWTDHWVYWLGPILGGLAAALIYQHAFSAPAVEVAEYSLVQLKQFDGKKDEDGNA